MTFQKNTIEVCFSPLSFSLFHNEGAIVVVIDVLRATSAICTAFHHGAESIIPVAEVEEARAYQAKGYLTAGERNGEVIDGFEFGNSPFSFMGDNIKGKTIVLTTTNGTQAIEVSRNAYQVVIGSFLNLDILSKWLAKQDRNVVLLCAGWKDRFCLEDTLFAGAIVKNLINADKHYTTCDSAMASLHLFTLAEKDVFTYLENSSHRRRLEKLSLEKDIRYCLIPDQTPVIPILKGKQLVKLNIDAPGCENG